MMVTNRQLDILGGRRGLQSHKFFSEVTFYVIVKDQW